MGMIVVHRSLSFLKTAQKREINLFICLEKTQETVYRLGIIAEKRNAMANVTIWHNPRCSKSRQALALLEEQGVEADVVKYLETSPSAEEIKALLKKLGVGARALMRTKEDLYKELDLKEVDDEEQLIAAMAEHPKLIERPVVIVGDKAVIGRPPEKVVELVKE
jgi:arsenate reductase